MSGYSRHHRASWHVGYTPSLDVNSNSTRSYVSRYTGSDVNRYTGSDVSRYGSSDVGSSYTSGGYRRYSSSDSTNRLSGGYSSIPSSTTSKYGSSTGSSYSDTTRRYSTTTDYSSLYNNSSSSSNSTGLPSSTSSYLQDYDKHRKSSVSSDVRRTSITDTNSSDVRRPSVTDINSSETRRQSGTDVSDDARRSSSVTETTPENSDSSTVTRRRSSRFGYNDTVGSNRGTTQDDNSGTTQDINSGTTQDYLGTTRDKKDRHDCNDSSSSANQNHRSGESEGSNSSSYQNVESTSSSAVLRRKCSVDRRTHLGLDYNKIPEEDVSDSRSRTTKAGTGLKSGHPPDVVSNSARGSRAQEIARLESLCESRTKELNVARMQLRQGLQAFDAVTCLLNYCTNQLDAFSCPKVTAQLQKAEQKLTEQEQSIESLKQEKMAVEKQLEEMTSARDEAQQQLTKLKEDLKQAEEAHSAAVTKLKADHEQELKTQLEDLSSRHQQSLQQMQKYQEKQSDFAHQSHMRQLSELSAEHQMATNQLKVAHLEEIQELRNKHDKQMEELHAQHRNKLEDITRRFESIKLSLSEKVQSLCQECEDLRVRARTSEDALQRTADCKVQLALAPYMNLPQEIESLRTVVDMRTEEIQKLRRHNMELEKQLEELPIAQEKCTSLQQKVENLQAIINIKTDHEKQLHEKCQVLMRKYDRESRANKRLSMDYEQVVWRMSQSADFTLEGDPSVRLSVSPAKSDHGSPSPVRRSLSAQPGSSDSNGVVTRRQRRISGGEENKEGERSIRTRSGTFSLDKDKLKEAMNGSDGAGKVDLADMIAASMAGGGPHDESFSSGTSDFHSMESSMILETPQGVSFNITMSEGGGVEATQDANSTLGGGDTSQDPNTSQDEVFMESMELDGEVKPTNTTVNGSSHSHSDDSAKADVTLTSSTSR